MRDPRVTLATIVKLLFDARDNANAQARRVRDAQKQRGLAIDTRGDYAEGSVAAYNIALSIVAGAAGVADPRTLTEVTDHADGETVVEWDRLAKNAGIIEHDPVNDQADAIVVASWPIDHAEGE